MNDGRIFTPFVGARPTIMLPGIWGGANWPPSAYDPATQRLFVCASSVVNGYAGGGDPNLMPARQRRRRAVHRRQCDVRAGSAQRHRGGARCDHEQDRVAFPLGRPVLQRPAQRGAACCSSAAPTAASPRSTRRPARSSGNSRPARAYAPVSTFERNGKQYVIAYSAGSALIGSARGDSVWLFALDGKLPPATAGRAVSRLEGAANPAPAAANPRQSQRIPRRGRRCRCGSDRRRESCPR